MTDPTPSFEIHADRRIRTAEAWLKFAGPKKGDAHWREGRSARESARAWLRTGTAAVPAEISDLLRTREETADFRPILAIPELVTRLDDSPGEHRNHDLIVLGEARGGRTLIAIEAKADEAFGDSTAGAYLDASAAKQGSGVPARVRMLAEALFGSAAFEADGRLKSPVAALQYQLLTAVGGMLIEARRRWSEQAVFVVHEFTSDDVAERGYRGTRRESLERNSAALAEFVAALGGGARGPETLAGSFRPSGGGLVPGQLPFFVGKATVHIDPFSG